MVPAKNNLPTTFAPTTLAEAMDFAKMLSESSFVPAAYKNKPGDVLAAMQMGAEIGLAPLQALQNIAVINGRPSIWGDAMLALVRASGLLVHHKEYLENEGTPNMTGVCEVQRKGDKEIHVVKFSKQDAQRAGLAGKQGPWQQYEKRMLILRPRGFALRDIFPDVLKGLISREEAMDYVDITPTNNGHITLKVDEPVTSAREDLLNPPLPPEVRVVEPEVTVSHDPQPVDDPPIGNGSSDYEAVMEICKLKKIKKGDLYHLLESEYGCDDLKDLPRSLLPKLTAQLG